MATIHVNTDLLRQLGNLFRQLNAQIHQQIKPQLQVITNQLEADWQGQTRARYDQLFSDWNITLDRLTQAGDELGHHLQDTVTLFEQADQSL